VCVSVRPRNGYGVSGEFCLFKLTQGWKRLEKRSPFDKIFSTLLSQVTRSLSVSSLVRIDTFLLGLIYFLDQMSDLSFIGGGCWLDFFCFLDMNEIPLYSAVPDHLEVSINEWCSVCDWNLSCWDFKRKYQEISFFLSFFLSWLRLLEEKSLFCEKSSSQTFFNNFRFCIFPIIWL